MIEKNTLFQKAVLNNTRLAKQIPKTFSESEVIRDISELKKNNGIISSKTTSKLSNSNFFQLAIFLIIILLIIYFLWHIFSYLYSFISPINEEKNLLNYKIPINKNYNYGFPI